MKILVSALLETLDVVHYHGAEDAICAELIALGDSSPKATSLFWCSDKNIEVLKEINLGIVILSEKSFDYLKQENKISGLNCVIVSNPRLAFMKVLNAFFVKKDVLGTIAKSATILSDIETKNVLIGENVVVEENVLIGNNVIIGHNTVVKEGTVIGNNVKIGSNNTIGGVGFGYEINELGEYELIPHIGNVLINDNVEIGNNTCIDRAVIGSTILGESSKIDNLVHIAHGVKIGKNSLIIANAMIAGSVEIGSDVWISPSSSIMQKLKIEDDSLVGMGSVVIKNVEKSTIVAGVPAKMIKKK
jgi:UDP-3-O-[3-hydroxymyristoyl] glucosamine N-acyltransferase